MNNEIVVRNEELLKSIDLLTLHGNRDDVPAIVEYRLAYLIEQVNPLNRAFTKARNKLLRTYALRAEDGGFLWMNGQEGNYQIDPDKFDEYETKLQELEQLTHTIKWVPMPAKHLENKRGSIPGGAISLVNLKPFLDRSDLERELANVLKDEGWEDEASAKTEEPR